MSEPQSQTELLSANQPPGTEVHHTQTDAADSCTAGGEGDRPDIPQTIGRYQVRGILGEGGMGIVLRAFDPQLDRTVAIKLPLLGGQGSQMTSRRQRFLREARAAAAIAHPNICAIHDVGEMNGQPFVVMAFIEGETLASRVTRESTGLDPTEAVRLMRGVAEGLAVVHRAGVIHRDLKPGNILLDRAGNPVLTDFGLARVIDDAEHATVDGAVMGTPAYMAPEQAAGNSAEIGPWTDVYGLGAVLYHLLAGRPPFTGPTLSILVKVLKETPPPLASLRPDLAPNLIAVVEKSMAGTPSQRFANAGEFAAALPHQPVAFTPVSVVPARKFAWVWAAAMLAGVLGVALWFATRPPVPTMVPSALPGPSAEVSTAVLPLEAEFSLLVWSANNGGPKMGVPIQDPVARPLRTDEKVQFRVRFNQPAYAYLAWITPEGEVVLLHPWNRVLADRTITGRPPEMPPAREVFSPADSDTGWQLDDTLGAETIVLMARLTPLPADVDVQKVLGRLEALPDRGKDEFYWLILEGEASAVRYKLPGFASALRGPRLTPQAVDTSCTSLIKRLRNHFDHVELIRFRHSELE